MTSTTTSNTTQDKFQTNLLKIEREETETGRIHHVTYDGEILSDITQEDGTFYFQLGEQKLKGTDVGMFMKTVKKMVKGYVNGQTPEQADEGNEAQAMADAQADFAAEMPTTPPTATTPKTRIPPTRKRAGERKSGSCPGPCCSGHPCREQGRKQEQGTGQAQGADPDQDRQRQHHPCREKGRRTLPLRLWLDRRQADLSVCPRTRRPGEGSHRPDAQERAARR